MAGPKFLQRVARLPELFTVLAAYPDGLPVNELAARFDVAPDVLREDLFTYLDLESWGWMHDIFRLPAVEFVHASSVGSDTEDATVVRLVGDSSSGLGAEHLGAGDLALLYTAGTALLDTHPDDPHLAAALGVIAETMYGEPTVAPRVGDWNQLLDPLRRGMQERRRVEIVYSRAWSPGVSTRTVEPLRLVQTRRGWEVDAGPVAQDGSLRTFLLSNVRSAVLLDEPFEPPEGAGRLLERQRSTSTVRMELAQEARWAADMYAEKVHVVEDGEEVFVADLDLLPPVGQRVGLLMLASGPTTRVLAPTSVLPTACGVIEELLHHHERTP